MPVPNVNNPPTAEDFNPNARQDLEFLRAVANGGPADDATNRDGVAIPSVSKQAAQFDAMRQVKVDEFDLLLGSTVQAVQRSAGQWPDTASAMGAGVSAIASLVAGSGGANGTFALGFSGGTQIIPPQGHFVVAGGAVVEVVIDYPGYYSAGSPTLSFAASSGLSGASATAVMAPNTPQGGYFTVPDAGTGAVVMYRVESGPVAARVANLTTAYFDPREYEQSGYSVLVLGSDFSLLYGVTDEAQPKLRAALFESLEPMQFSAFNLSGQTVNFLPAAEYEQCGYGYVVVGSDFSLLFGVTSDAIPALRAPLLESIGASDFNALKFNGHQETYLASSEYQQCGFARFTCDGDFRIFEGLTDDAFPVLVSHAAAPEMAPPTWVEGDDFAVFTARDVNGRSQIYSQNKSTGITVQLTSRGSNTNPRITSDGRRVAFASNRPQIWDTKSLWGSELGGSTHERDVFAAFPRKSLTTVGDSIGAGSGASTPGSTDIASLVASSLAIPQINTAIGGQTTQQIGMRFDALDTFLTVASNSIPASGAVSVSAINGQSLAGMSTVRSVDYRLLSTAADNTSRSLVGWLEGVLGVLTRTASGGPPSATETYSFTRIVTAGTPTAVPAQARFRPHLGWATAYPADQAAVMIVGGINDTSQNYGNLVAFEAALEAAKDNIAAIVARIRSLNKAYIVLGEQNLAQPSEYVGTQFAGARATWRAEMSATYGTRWIDMQALLLAAGDGTAGDNTDIANGICPRSKRASAGTDIIHLNDAGYAVIAAAAGPALQPQLTY